jgi:serpin B
MKKLSRYFLSMLLVFNIFALTACGNSNVIENPNSVEVSDGVEREDVSSVEITAPAYEDINPKEELTDFALNILKEGYKGENILLSPLSIVSALGMTANGAVDNTLVEMEAVLQTDTDSLNDFLEAYVKYLPTNEKYKVSIANSIWMKDKEGLVINEDFLAENKTYYDAEVYKALFDEQTKDDINDWVTNETDGMIDHLLDSIPRDAVMYLINALSFDAEWAEIYENTAISTGTFTTINGEEQDAEFMHSEEYQYLEMENATGFMKPYADGEYAFVALLPNEGVEMNDFIQSMNGEVLSDALENVSEETVYASIPKFTVEYDTLLNDPLISLGMHDAFDGENADFTNLGTSKDGNLYISRVIHKTKIQVDEKGTKAGAVTAVEIMECTSAEMFEPKIVDLDRPFIYMIVDTEQNFPIFMGNLNSVE